MKHLRRSEKDRHAWSNVDA